MDRIGALAMISLLGAGASEAAASSPQEWARFQRDVETTCLQTLRRASAVNASDRLQIRTSNYGSESYGAALITATNRRSVKRYVCIMDKRTRRAEFAEIDGPVR